jgi:4'-phosphopantetheinyl transferase
MNGERLHASGEGGGSATSTLTDEAVHVWAAHVSELLPCLGELASVLTCDECARAELFVREQDRNRYVVSRGMLRHTLSRYLGVCADRLRFRYGRYGKPELDDPDGRGISFNVSHSHDWVVCALTRNGQIGIDIEYMHATGERDLEPMARTVFCASEIDTFLRLPPAQRREMFFRLWTHKEACMKAIGTGFSLPPTEIELSIAPGSEPRLLRAGSESTRDRWFLREFNLAAGYAASLATESPASSPQFLRWSCRQEMLATLGG